MPPTGANRLEEQYTDRWLSARRTDLILNG